MTTLNATSTNRKQVAALLLGIVLAIALCVGIVYKVRQETRQKRAFILKNPGVATGIITRRRTIKSRRVTIRYRVGGQDYTLRARTSRAFMRGHRKGDTTAVVYAKADPAQALLKASLQRND
ncbi:hypothetical protein [Hymenobacter sp. B81]|uniref:DUF3592 domain-containing protein n=1 Tax=Hymenobacter sp. B81 TaxID=3344878 RepID=UPI0037DD3CB3